MSSIAHLRARDTGLEVTWSDGTVSAYPWLWLRDHAHDDATLHAVTKQRLVDTASLDPHLRASEAVQDGADVVVTWSSGADPSALPVEFLHRFRTPRPAVTTPAAPEPTLWDAATIADAPVRIAHDAVMADDAGVQAWLTIVATWGFAVVTGTPATADATEQLVRRVSYVRETIFGGFWEFTADLKQADLAYTNVRLAAHTDGTYSNDAPGLQLLHCLHFDGTGGESTLVDGFGIAAAIRAESPAAYELLSTVPIPGQYIGDGAHLMAARPVFRHDHHGTLVQVSYNNADRAPFLLDADEMTALYAALRLVDDLANSAALQWRQVLCPGDALLFDNWRVLHGREAFTGRRTLCGAYVNREDFESRRRVTA